MEPTVRDHVPRVLFALKEAFRVLGQEKYTKEGISTVGYNPDMICVSGKCNIKIVQELPNEASHKPGPYYMVIPIGSEERSFYTKKTYHHASLKFLLLDITSAWTKHRITEKYEQMLEEEKI